uniref:Polyprotein n=1 Tax=Oryza sativa subsp. japonica TaxID=39947 RepID=Q5WMP5_ORYSJ|nr:putative polyprotein [Oryza sativa Japonica Group]
MDRQWMYADRRSKEFIDDVHYFLSVAKANRQRGFICCPCNKCKNQKEYSASRTIHFHLFESGFMPSYNCWKSHGEQGVEMEEDEVEDDNIPDFAKYVGFEGNQMGEEERDADGNDVAEDLGQMLQDTKEDCESEKGAHKLDKMLEDHRTSLYPGCVQGHKKLDTTLEFLQWKAKNGVSDKAFDDLLKLVKNILPEGNKLPETTYEAKKIVCPLGLEVQKIHACPNDCILYRGEEYENLEACPVCKALRYKIRRDDPGQVDGQLTKKRIPAKSNKGYKACTHCMDEIESTYLKHYRKVVCMGHRRFLAANHPVRKKGKHFEHKADHRTKPKHRNGKTVFAMVKDLKVVFGKGPGSQPIQSEDGHVAMWKKNSIFWELPYWEFLDVRHAIDVMHLTKNLCVNLLGFLGLYGKSKDTLEACNDLKHMEQRGDLHSKPKEKGSHYLSPASYTLSKAEKEIVIRGILPHNVRATITKLCAFMNAISQKVIDPDRLEALQNDMVQCLVSFELIFTPSFFNIMTHLLCHLVKEISILGPVYLHNIFPFERYIGVLKKYVRNRARPENLSKIFAQSGYLNHAMKGDYGKGNSRKESNNDAPYIEEHLALVRARNIGKSDAWITRHHIDTFLAWIRQHLMGNESINQQLAFLARGPSGSITTFQGYEINGYTFYTRAQDMKSTNQNSAVRVDAMGHDGTTGTYSGAIEDIWELDYGPLKVPLFWLTGGGVMIDDSGMTTVDLNKVGYSDEPFVHANDVTQVFLVKDMSSKGKKGRGPDEPKRHVVLPGKRKIVGVEDKTDEDYDQLDGQPPFTVTIDPSILLSNEDTPYSHSDHKEGTIGELYKKYILKGQTPNFDTFPKLRDHWDEFVAYKTGEQEQEMMERNKENAAKKKYHHHLGSGGYSVTMPKWEEMEASLLERGIEPATANWPERSKFWYYAHGGTLNPANGSLVFSDQIREAARRLTDEVEASSQGTFRPDRERDELSLALQTPEHSGRTRGKGVIPWKIGFKEDIHTYRSRMRSKRDTEAKIADLEFRVSSYELSMQEEVARKVDESMAAHRSNDPQPTIPPAMVSPLGNRSSCASTGQVGSQSMDAMQTQDESTCPVDDITQRTPCELHIPFKNLSIKVASGMAIPTDPSGTYHCRPIPAGYSKVEVELVEGAYEDLELDYPGGDAPSPPQAPAPTPPQAPAPTPPRSPTLTPLQAPLPAPSKSRAPQAPPPAHRRATKKVKIDAAKNKDPGYDCTQEELDAYVASEVKRQFKPRSPEKKIPIDPSVMNFFRGMSAPTKEAIKLSDYERTLKKASSGKSKPVPQLGEQPNQEIEPLVTGKEMMIQEFITDTGLTTDQLLGVAPIEKAEVKYMYELGKPLVKPELLQSLPTQIYKFHQLYMEMSATGREMIGVRIRDTDFLMEIQRARRRGVFDTGFIDPQKVNVAMLDQYPQATEDNLVHLLKAQHYKTFILLPYNTEFHCVLLLFDLSACTVNVYDSMDKKESMFDKVFELIDRAWYRFRHLVRGKWRERLRRKFKFPCAKQKKGTNLCGYYVCEYCHCLADQIITTRELNYIRMRDNLTTHKEFITAVQEQLMGFISEQILDPKGEFYYDGNTIHRSLASELATTTTSKS